MKPYSASIRGFTLIELVMIIVVLGLLAAIAIPRMGGVSESAKVNATKSEMAILKKAIVGNSQVTAGGRYIDVGFEGDVGHPPGRLQDLVFQPDSIQSYNSFTRIGWNGPYIDSAEGNYLYDAWDNAYLYDASSRTIKSINESDTIIIRF